MIGCATFLQIMTAAERIQIAVNLPIPFIFLREEAALIGALRKTGVIRCEKRMDSPIS